ncbi:hypothetical protein [Micromonospora craterilacus]|uniref:hypothetical protein n=1 Tax=Micromonospora craterilacus TaxID=1655439 RepID=UPI0011B6C5E6|nr:hypothetical protein [Micromonospora craterilacus]
MWPFWPDESEKKEASEYVSGLEYLIAEQNSKHIFNEKKVQLPTGVRPDSMPASVRFDLYCPATRIRLGHPDVRIRRRAAMLAKLSTRISERSLANAGLRLSLLRQLARLTELAEQRFEDLGGMDKVDVAKGEDD